MHRRQRSAHLVLWLLISVVVIATIGLGVRERRRLDTPGRGPPDGVASVPDKAGKDQRAEGPTDVP